ncbi:MutS-related protein [Halocalculus aciditolerans]|uniref:DNA mismatch repair protein n=1 Tax=Halocalculus aciditolerans TaxID=1383812 RepID=A0A830FN20_9EURY|nr:DNA mismatch repair protein [Halocalculus aciditolerans]GGL72043.1 hypothetical protein GCM10009039_32650 [Halocalculus aciditolerans]
MRLEEYWGVGPKTAALLSEALGVEAAVSAIESANSRALVEAGVSSGRATRILRRANGGEGLDLLATDDARDIYKDLVERAQSYAVTGHAADRIRVLTPLLDADAIEARLDLVGEARETWRGLDAGGRERVLAVFDAHDAVAGGEASAVDTAVDLLDAGFTDGVFAPLGDLDADALADASTALSALDDGGVAPGADDRLDEYRESLDAVERLARDPASVMAAVRSEGVQGTEGFREAFVEYVVDEAGVSSTRVRRATEVEAADAADFVSNTLRGLADDLREDVEQREAAVADDLRDAVDDARADVDAAVEAVDDIAFALSLARFADAFDLTRPTLVDDGLAVVGARNLDLEAEGESVQPIDYGVGVHALGASANGASGADGITFGEDATGTPMPSDDAVAVLTGANSGGKTTVLETLCEVSVLAHLGLPVPAEHAEVPVVDAVVFHRRHASFNAGVLESTLKSVVPPVTAEGKTIMLVDEFEAITEPGSAADLLHGLVTLTVDRGALGVFVTHLADDLEPLPDAARVDGIFAEGLTPDLELEVDYQPRFGVVGRSTPEFIVSRLIANARNPAERAGYEALAEAVGHEVVQRTLSDARWDA